MQTQEMIITKKKRVGQAEREQKVKVYILDTTHSVKIKFFFATFIVSFKVWENGDFTTT